MKKCRNLKNEIKTRSGDSINLLYCSHIVNKSRRSYIYIHIYANETLCTKDRSTDKRSRTNMVSYDVICAIPSNSSGPFTHLLFPHISSKKTLKLHHSHHPSIILLWVVRDVRGPEVWPSKKLHPGPGLPTSFQGMTIFRWGLGRPGIF